MSSFPGSPRLQKGALVTMDPLNPPGTVIAFHYNPETLSRSLAASSAGGGGDAREALRLGGPPAETIQVEVEFDATDQLAEGDATARESGLHPTLAALEGLLYPRVGAVIANEALLNLGVMEIVPPEAPLTIFVWGRQRVLPVRVTDFSVTEEAFDADLNPTRAKVRLGLRVLTYQDLGFASPGGALFLAHHLLKETLAAQHRAKAGPLTILPGGVPVPARRG